MPALCYRLSAKEIQNKKKTKHESKLNNNNNKLIIIKIIQKKEYREKLLKNRQINRHTIYNLKQCK